MSLDDFLKSEFDWETDAYGVNITDYYGKGGNVVVPKIIDGKPVTSIGRWAFCGCSGLVSITIPVNVTRIGVKAFEGSCLADVWYTGSRAQWKTFADYNRSSIFDIDKVFGNATIHFGIE